MTNYYDILGVSKDASAADIKTQYRKLAQQYHPDRYSGEDAGSKMQEINSAYQTLKDPQKRAAYDQPQPQQHQWGNMRETDIEEILRHVRSGFGGFGNQRRQSQPMAQVNISLEEAFTGTTRTLNGNEFTIPAGVRSGNQLFVDGFIIIVGVQRHRVFQRSEDDLATGVEISAVEAMLGVEFTMKNLDDKRLKVKIPAGIQHGQMVRVAGQGMPNPEFQRRGDLLVQVAITIPRDLTDKERDAIMNLKHRKTFDV